MPSRLLVLRPIIALLAALLVIGALQPPAGAATKRALSITASPTSAVAKSAVTVSGKLTRSPRGTVVKIQRKVGTKWVAAGSTRTKTAAGAYAAKVTLPATAAVYSYRAIAVKTKKLKAATSRTIKISALARVVATLKSSADVVPAGQSVTLSGTVKPFTKFAIVSIQKKVGSTWQTAAVAGLGTTGTFSQAIPLTETTTFRLSVPRKGLYLAAVSAEKKVTTNPVITTSQLPAGTVGTSYSQTLSVVGNPAGTWSVTPTLPAGLSLNTATGAITGTPTTAETKALTFGFTQTSTGLAAAPAALSLTINPATPPVISTTSLPGGTAGTAYSAQLAVTGNPAGTWTVSPGLPGGLSLNGMTGAITGTPTVASSVSHTFTFHQTNTGLSGTKALTLDVVMPPAPVILTLSLPDARPLVNYSAQLFVSGGVPGIWSATGLPGGLTLDPATGAISGKAADFTKTYNVTVGFTRAGTGQAASPVVIPLKLANVAPAVPVAVGAGGQFSCRTDADQKLWCWGYNESGQLGINGTIGDGPGKLTPQQVGTATDWSGITTGNNNLITERHACALRGTDAWCWGSDKNGEIGAGGTAAGNTAVPVKVVGGLSWAKLDAGWNSTCGVTTTGALYCWGKNDQGQLGIGSASVNDVNAPARVGVANDWTSVSTGYNFGCAIKATGTLWCWGANHRGQLGTGGTTSTSAPVQVGTATDWSKVRVGYGYTCGIRTNGTLWCWGITDGGSLGNGETANDTAKDVLAPVQVGTATNWSDVTAGSGQTCAVNTAGQLWCWGKNGNGQVGNNSLADQGTPIRIGTASNWETVSAGDTHTCGVQTDGDIFCWGANTKGQLGNNSTAQSRVPVGVVG
ncbi:hypothetical protein EFK50_20740 [Nocardioides marmoriginsengisoli]|uniref:RCC1-like domain-containing protein n=1 Tax=Nocardioides marmoriginsengisoli TaxID=661483 RepID=A0A3N0CBA3_9ACTN|nr:putative Ig domain-containing protein [Nocardioides marmoriginsengisoli]RNL60735.1 hypothetical protein EFK50_20740 [Nocardioides marmoriginsengisoli]